jgi:LPS-assembly lipoprotein
MRMKFICILLLINCLFLTACGFHLRSSADIPAQLKILYVESAVPHSNLAPLLIQNLQSLDVHVVPRAQDAPVTLEILSENFSQSKAVLGTAQQINTVNLYYTVTFTLKSRDQKTYISPVTLTTTTSYLQNATQILGDTLMLPSYQQMLMRNMVDQIIFHLSAKNVHYALHH